MESKIFNKNNIDTIYYHNHCPDGSCSKNIILYYLVGPDKIECIGLTHPYKLDDHFFENAKGKNNIMVDFSLKRDDLQRLIDVSNTFLILDHHKTAEEDLQMIDENLKIFGVHKSGAGLTWDYFFPNKPRPRVVTFIEDQDIWTFKDPDTKAFNTIFHQLEQTYDVWLNFITNEELVDETITKGRITLEYEDTLVRSACDSHGYQLLHKMNDDYVVVATINSTMFISQLGNTLLKKFEYADFSCVLRVGHGKTKFSLRSLDTRLDVSQVAKSFPKGGGHRNASGFDLEGLYDSMPYPVVGYVDQQDNVVTLTLKMAPVDMVKLEDFIQRKFKDQTVVLKYD